MSKLRVGDVVSVRANVERPRYGWGAVTHDSQGVVIRVLTNGRVQVDFSAQRGWLGHDREMKVYKRWSVKRMLSEVLQRGKMAYEDLGK